MGKSNSYDPDIEDPDDIAVTVWMEDGTKREFAIVSIFTAGTRDYIALIPYGRDNEPDLSADIYFYRYEEDENEEGSIENIESDEEFAQVSAAFNALMPD